MILALLASPMAYAQVDSTAVAETELKQDEADAFIFNESQLGEDDDVTSDVIQINSSTNVYTSNIGYAWSAARFKFRALDNRYNDIYLNGVQVNNVENGRFIFSNIGGINDATRNKESVTPFEANAFGMSSLGGSTNYDFRAADMATGHKVTLTGLNRNYSLRAMYSYGSGLTKNGWAFFGTVGYRWSNMSTANVDGTFYNSLSYFLAVQKVFNEKHSLNLAVWGNPTERAQQGASTDEAYWLANDRLYNPYWGYQNGKKRSSRIVNDFAPSALLTWDYKINDDMKLVTTAYFKYQMYSATRLNYNDSRNPAPDYWKNFPSAYYDVWDQDNIQNWEYGMEQWQDAYDYWTASKANRQIDFDRLYAANQVNNLQGKDAAYFITAKHNDHINGRLASTFNYNIDLDTKFNLGIQMGYNKGMHYQTIEDMMGANMLHNVNNYAIGTYLPGSPQTQYDVNNPTAVLGKGDKYAYDYDLFVRDIRLWAGIVKNKGISHNYITAKIGGQQMWRNGHMNNGICQNFVDSKGVYQRYSYGKSDVAGFLEGGFKMGSTLNLGKGNAISLGVGYEARAPQASTAFVSPEMNNSFVKDLHCEKIASAELSYALNISWLRLNATGYISRTYDGTEWQNFYFDDNNCFTYVSLTNVQKYYYGAELGAKFKVLSNLDINLLGTYGEAQYANNSNVAYMLSTEGTTKYDICYNDGMRESGTPLAAASLGVDYRIKGWFLNLTGNYYDRIYLSYSPCMRYGETLIKTAAPDPITGELIATIPEQAKGDGGFMLDASIGHQFRFKNSTALSVNLNLCNITNNTGISTGGYEQSRSNYSTNKNGTQGNERIYDFRKNPKKFYAQGFNFMLNINYRF